MYSCFISYCHGQNELTKAFVEELKKALKSCIEPYMKEEVYIDEERLIAGYNYNEELAQAICSSICMIVIYCPRYEKQSYCLREFEGMKIIEERRRALLGSKFPKSRGMIIPIVFRGKTEDLPPAIKSCKHYYDFSRFSLASIKINEYNDYIDNIDNIAQLIFEHCKMMQESGIDLCAHCETFQLPSEKEIQGWRNNVQKISVAFPGRE